MNNTKYLIFGFLILTLTISTCKSYRSPDSDHSTSKQPNIVFIMADDHAVSAISAYQDWLAVMSL